MKTNHSNPKNIFYSAAFSVILAAGLSFLLAKLIDAGVIPIEMMDTAAGAILGATAFVGTFLCAKKAHKAKFLCSLLSGAVFELLLLAAYAIMERGELPETMWKTVIVFTAAFTGGLVGCIKKKPDYL